MQGTALHPAIRPWRRILAPLILIGCGNPPGPEVSVGQIVLSKQTATILPGQTVPIAVYLLDENGAQMERRVTWRSSDALIATVNDTGLVSGVAPGSAEITASSGGTSASMRIGVGTRAWIGPEGGALRMLYGSAMLEVPPGAVSGPTPLDLVPAPGASVTNNLVPGTSYYAGGQGLSFRELPMLTIMYDPARLPGGGTEQGLRVGWLSNGAWQQLQGSQIDTSAKRVSARIAHSGIYAVIAVP